VDPRPSQLPANPYCTAARSLGPAFPAFARRPSSLLLIGLFAFCVLLLYIPLAFTPFRSCRRGFQILHLYFGAAGRPRRHPSTSSAPAADCGEAIPPSTAFEQKTFRSQATLHPVPRRHQTNTHLLPTPSFGFPVSKMASTDGNVDVPIKRDIKNHLLFEIATEVANRGGHPLPPHSKFQHS
jgi:hypothetical protein